MLVNHPSRRSFLKAAAATAVAATTAGLLPTSPSLANENLAENPENGKNETIFKPKWVCSSVNYSSLPLEEACQRIASLGYEAIDVWDSIEGYLECPHLAEIAEKYHAEGFKKLLEKYHLNLGSFTVYMAKYPKFAKLLGQCGSGGDGPCSRLAVRGSQVGGLTGNVTNDMKKFLEGLKPELDLCERYDSFLAVENHSGDCLLNRNDTFKAFVDLNDNKRLGIAFAPYHVMHNDESVADAIRICDKQLFFVYLWTNELGEKQMPGIGITNVADWFVALREIKYDKLVTPFMHEHPDPARMDELHRQSLQYLKSFV
ncbi:MAG: sugar phosphate isomerase/epimerase [Planctomycetaceae bacterium]|nr:sugar phosphate isomerase/epimerase [Planctomycetaceae bacterium]